jgi:hypothetical protein
LPVIQISFWMGRVNFLVLFAHPLSWHLPECEPRR